MLCCDSRRSCEMKFFKVFICMNNVLQNGIFVHYLYKYALYLVRYIAMF